MFFVVVFFTKSNRITFAHEYLSCIKISILILVRNISIDISKEWVIVV